MHMLRIDSNILWTIVNLLILYAFMMRFLFKPVRNIIAKRNEEIKASFEDVKKQKDEALELKNQADQQLKNMQTICDSKLAEAKIQASQEYEKIIADANQKSEEMIEEARQKTIEASEQEKAKAQSAIAEMINQAAAKIAGDRSNEELYDDFLKEME